MRHRALFLATALFFVALALPLATHAAIPFFGPIIPGNAQGTAVTQTCALGWGAVIVVINNIIQFAITLLIVAVAPLMIAYAGFLYVINPVNPSGREKANGMLLNLVIGIVVALAGWLIVDAVMAVLYNPAAVGSTWSSIISTGGLDPCLKVGGATEPAPGAPASGVGAGSALPQLPVATVACTAEALQSYGINASIASQMSCIAQQESSCNANSQNTSSTAHGLFQVVMGFNDQGHNLNFPACTQAAQNAGYGYTGDLNCSQAFTGGKIKAGQEQLASACIAASSNVSCNAAAAQWLYTNKNGFSNWSQTAGKCGISI